MIHCTLNWGITQSGDFRSILDIARAFALDPDKDIFFLNFFKKKHT